jgi:hypothetical protein
MIQKSAEKKRDYSTKNDKGRGTHSGSSAALIAFFFVLGAGVGFVFALFLISSVFH